VHSCVHYVQWEYLWHLSNTADTPCETCCQWFVTHWHPIPAKLLYHFICRQCKDSFFKTLRHHWIIEIQWTVWNLIIACKLCVCSAGCLFLSYSRLGRIRKREPLEIMEQIFLLVGYAPRGAGAPPLPLSSPCPFTSSFALFYFSLLHFLVCFTYFLLLSILSLSTRIVPLHFQAGGCGKWSNLGLVCCVYFVLSVLLS